MERETLKYPINPYQYVRYVIGAKWKMTILHDIHLYDSVHFNETAKNLQVSEKVLSKQLRELVDDGLVTRIQYDTIPPYTEHLGHIMARQDNWRSPSKLKKSWPEDWFKQGGSD